MRRDPGTGWLCQVLEDLFVLAREQRVQLAVEHGEMQRLAACRVVHCAAHVGELVVKCVEPPQHLV